jgi:hypothetical protein
MCDASSAIMGGSMLMQAQGQQQSAQNQAAMAGYQSQVAGYNTAVAQQKADFAREDADDAVLERHREVKRFTGQQRARLAASGVELSSGTPLEVMASTESLGKRYLREGATQDERSVWAASVGVEQERFGIGTSLLAQSSAQESGFWSTGETMAKFGSFTAGKLA